jgi:DNA adenine methylase
MNMNIDKRNLPKPLLKWVGGKQKHIEHIINGFPKEINNYHEPFIGGASVLLALLWASKENIINIKGNIFAYDLNESLIHTYENIKVRPQELYDIFTPIIEEYHSIVELKGNQKPMNEVEGLSSKESYYYWIRKKFNQQEDKKTIISSAYFIFLNKTGFRGMYREGPNGMNIPYGHYVNVVFTLEELSSISELLQPVTFIHCDFSEALSTTDDNDFIYLDPPYAPENDNSFVGYTKDGFDIEQHKKLFAMCNDVSEKAKIMMSNANVPLIREYFNEDIYDYKVISCRRAINSKNPGAKTEEVVITNH